MYPPEDNASLHGAAPGDRIEHKMLPGLILAVQEVKDCELDGARPEPHSQYRVLGPDGNTDWLCAYDCRAVRS
jgi:hypothetical protein